jgi:hypothetical protein
MDTFTRQHFTQWFDRQFPPERYDELVRLATEQAMIELYSSDPEYWYRISYWSLYDAVERQQKGLAPNGRLSSM